MGCPSNLKKCLRKSRVVCVCVVFTTFWVNHIESPYFTNGGNPQRRIPRAKSYPICWLQHVSAQFKYVGQIGSSLQAEVTFLTCLEVKPPLNIFWSAFPHVHHYHSPWFSLHLFFDSSPSLCPIHHDMKGIVPHKTAKTAMMELGVLRFLDSFLGQKMIIHLVCLHLHF